MSLTSRLLLLASLAASASATLAQVTSYRPNDFGRPIVYYNVAGSGDEAISLMGGITSLNPGGSNRQIDAQFSSVSSDGRFMGIAFDPAFLPVYLDFDGSLKSPILDPASFTAQFGGRVIGMEGSFIQTRSASPDNSYGIENFFNGVKLPGIGGGGVNVYQREGITKTGKTLNDLTQSSGFRTTEVFDPNGISLAVLSATDGTGILQQGRGPGEITVNINDLVANDKIVYEWQNAATGGRGSGIYDIATGQANDLADSSLRAVRMNTQGDVLALKAKSVYVPGFGAGGSGTWVDGYEFWFNKSGSGWVNASEINGMELVLSPYLQSFDLSEGGSIYGTLDGSFRTNSEIVQTFKMAPVPEPSSMILLALGAGGLIAARRRKRN